MENHHSGNPYARIWQPCWSDTFENAFIQFPIAENLGMIGDGSGTANGTGDHPTVAHDDVSPTELVPVWLLCILHFHLILQSGTAGLRIAVRGVE